MRLLAPGIHAALTVAFLAFRSPTFASQACDRASFDVKILAMNEQSAIEEFNLLIIAGRDVTPEMQAQLQRQIISTGLDMRAAIRKGCHRGDMLQLPVAETGLTKDLCDFGKSIVNDGKTVTCVVR